MSLKMQLPESKGTMGLDPLRTLKVLVAQVIDDDNERLVDVPLLITTQIKMKKGTRSGILWPNMSS